MLESEAFASTQHCIEGDGVGQCASGNLALHTNETKVSTVEICKAEISY